MKDRGEFEETDGLNTGCAGFCGDLNEDSSDAEGLSDTEDTLSVSEDILPESEEALESELARQLEEDSYDLELDSAADGEGSAPDYIVDPLNINEDQLADVKNTLDAGVFAGEEAIISLLAFGKLRGYITVDELEHTCSDNLIGSDMSEQLYDVAERNGIRIVTDPDDAGNGQAAVNEDVNQLAESAGLEDHVRL